MSDFWFLYYTFLVYNTFSAAVPNDISSNDADFAHQLTTMKNTLKILSDEWGKWNTLFITSLEPRITSTASTLSSIDNNIHNLHERAHIWDTFQLHVAAWNDQLSSLDRKMDILNKGIEQVTTVEAKINTLLSGDFKLDKVIKMTTAIQQEIVDIGSGLKSKQDCKSAKDSLFEEFAARGILSSLKLVERKVDRLLTTRNNENGMKLGNDQPVIRYVISKSMENLINDISSKVDIIFDTMSKRRENDYSDEYIDVEGSGSSTTPSHFRNVSNYPQNSSLIQPQGICTTLEKNLQNINEKIRNIESNISSLDKCNQMYYSNSTLNEIHKAELRDLLNNASKNVNTIHTNHIYEILESYHQKNKDFWSTMLNPLSKKCFPTISKYPEHTTSKYVESPPSILLNSSSQRESTYSSHWNQDAKFGHMFENNRDPKIVNQSSCNDLAHDSARGIYIFRGVMGYRTNERFTNKQYCEMREDGLWTLIQRRDNYTIQQDFNVSWQDYNLGFGDLQKDFWIGNNYLSRVSKDNKLILRIELEDFDGNQVWAQYEDFRIAGEDQQFRLLVHGYSGNATDSFSSHSGSKFSTYDKQNDEAPECCPCSISYGGGWWFNRCFESNLNGVYYKKPLENDYFRGLIWEHWLGNYSLKKSLMMIKLRPPNSINMSFNVPEVENP